MTETEKKEYKDTLNLPKTTLEMRANATKKEPETQKFWEEHEIYKKMTENKDKTNSFILHDGPPYLSSEKIHVGTALNKILKDILIKYKTQRGFYAPYVPGYDGHGLPIENKVVKVPPSTINDTLGTPAIPLLANIKASIITNCCSIFN